MTPSGLNPAIVSARLDQMRQILRDLEAAGPVDVHRLETEPLTRAAVERFLQALVDLAVDINAHMATAELGEGPLTAKRSFSAMARLGAIDEPLATSLAPAAGMRNVLVHGYLDIDVGQVAAAVPLAQQGFGAYIRQVAAYLLRREDGR